MRTLLTIAGMAQLGLALASLAIPRLLGWRAETAKLQALTGQVFWTYAAYIWASNVSFGLVSALAPGWLLDGAPLARAVCGFVALWWGARLGVQLLVFQAPPGALHRLADAALTALFCGLTAVYGWVAMGGAS